MKISFSFAALILLLNFSALLVPAAAEIPPSFRSPQQNDLPPGMLAFKSYGASQGRGDLSVWALEQDTDGFLWVGTIDGLFRYDGNRFKMFTTIDGLPSSRIKFILQGGQSRLWIGTVRGLALMEGSRIRVLNQNAGLPENEIFALDRDPEGRLWVAMEMGLFRQRPGALVFDLVPGWPVKTRARALWMDGDAVYTVSEIRLLRIDLKHPGLPQEVPGPWKERLDAVARDPQGRMWVRSRGGLWMRPTDKDSFEDLSKYLEVSTYDGHLRLTPRGALLIPTSDGLVRVQGDTWEYISTSTGLPTPWTNRVMEDREGCLWVGGQGLHRDLDNEAWRQHTLRNGIPGGVSWAILRDIKGRIWVGTTNGLCTARDGVWKLVPETKRGQAFLALVQAKDGAIWMGGAPPRLRRWVPDTNEWLEFSKPSSTISGLNFGADGTLWIISHREGVFRILPKQGSISNLQVEPFMFPGAVLSEKIQSIARGGETRLWMASTRGLLLQENGKWRLLGVSDGLLSSNTISVFEEDDGSVWVSYDDRQGLSHFNYKQGRLQLREHLDVVRGFNARRVYFVRRDALGRLWTGTSQGVDMLQNGQWFHFGAGEGMPGDDCEGNGFLAEASGNVWVGALGGLGHFDSTRFQGSLKPPASFVLSMQYGRSLLSPPFPAELDIKNRDNSVEFQFTGLTFMHENRVRIQVRLVGLENEWRFTNILQTRYTKLPPGSYRFEVRAGFDGKTWGPVAVLPFAILPAWWQTWWFKVAVVFSILGVILLIVRRRLRTLKQRNIELEQLVQARTKALAEANETLQKLTVTDTLTGLKNRRFLDLTIEDDLAKVNRDYYFVKKMPNKKKYSNLDLLFMMVDLDHFKEVNDRFGHAAGDLVLRQIRDRLLHAVRDNDIVVRWGGEEFLLVARSFDRSQAQTLANRVMDLIGSSPFDIGNGRTLVRTCSLGFAPYPIARSFHPESVSWHRVVEIADRCLYAAKESGRNGWVGLREGASPDRASNFLSHPDQEIAAGGWDIITSFPDVGALVWHKEAHHLSLQGNT